MTSPLNLETTTATRRRVEPGLAFEHIDVVGNLDVSGRMLRRRRRLELLDLFGLGVRDRLELGRELGLRLRL